MENKEQKPRKLFNKKNIEYIAKHFGKEEQIIKTQEELSELTMALTRFHSRFDHNIPKEYKDNLIEELADVEIMIAQIKYLLYINDEDVSKQKEFKIDRTLCFIQKRIEEHNKKCYYCRSTSFGNNIGNIKHQNCVCREKD